MCFVHAKSTFQTDSKSASQDFSKTLLVSKLLVNQWGRIGLSADTTSAHPPTLDNIKSPQTFINEVFRVNGYQQRAGLAIAGLAVGVVGFGAMVQPAHAAQTEITNLQLAPTSNGIQLTLQVQGNMRPPVFSVNRGNSSIVDISNAQLRLPNGSGFTQPNPVDGIGAVQVLQLNPDTVRVIVEGTGAAPIADVTRRDSAQGLMVMNFDRASGVASSGIPEVGGQPAPTGQYPSAVPPYIPRASAPPVGDLSVGSVNVEPDRIELGSSQIIPKLLLRDAPVREVLTLLGRSSGVNVAYAEGEGDDAGGPTISLDIENESVDDVFNYVVRLSGLQANRVGQTIFVGKTLPGDAQNRIVRTIRLNQMRATATTTYETSIETQADTGGSVGSTSSGGTTTAQTGINRNVNVTDQVEGTGAKEILESYGANGGSEGGSTLLTGLEVVADSRTNSLTLVGPPRKVEIASQLLTQLDVRKRQVAVNIKFVDVNLINQKFSDADLQFKFSDNLGIGLIPGGKDGAIGSSFGAIFGTAVNPTNVVTNLTTTFLGKLFAEVKNENAKVLMSPTLIVQEGSSAQLNLTKQIFSGFETSRTTSASSSGAETQAETRKPIIQNAGVIMNVNVDRIDDNGFVTLSLAPEVSIVGAESFNDQGTVAKLLEQRRLETGILRMRDGQTLVLAGIIKDEDRVTVSKIPLLGDIPILGRLFRDEDTRRERSELVVLVTPQIMDDSDQSSFGYQYRPSPEVEPLLRQP
jgi:type IV pilus assembly protein PilQ